MSFHSIKLFNYFFFSFRCRSIPAEQLDKINSELEKDIMIRAIHDVKGIDMGSSLVRYKVNFDLFFHSFHNSLHNSKFDNEFSQAEVDFDGRELTRLYLDKQDLNQLLEVSFGLWH